jgi:hypothetical protein
LLRVSKEALIIDPRTLMMGDEAPLIEALKAALAAAGPER